MNLPVVDEPGCQVMLDGVNAASGNDSTPRLIYADWLEDRGYEKEAKAVRLYESILQELLTEYYNESLFTLTLVADERLRVLQEIEIYADRKKADAAAQDG